MTWEGAWKNLELNSVWNSVTAFSRSVLVLVSPGCRNLSPPRPNAATLAVTEQLASVPVSFRRWSSLSDIRCWAAIAWNTKKGRTNQSKYNRDKKDSHKLTKIIFIYLPKAFSLASFTSGMYKSSVNDSLCSHFQYTTLSSPPKAPLPLLAAAALLIRMLWGDSATGIGEGRGRVAFASMQ